MQYQTKCKSSLIALFLFSLLATTQAQDNPAFDLSGLDTQFEKVLADWKVPGVGIAVVHKDQLLMAGGYGLKDVENNLPANENTLFAIGSSTKAFTATALCKLAGEGLIDMDEPVRTYLPDFELYDEYAGKKMTPRDLLCHRSGLPRHDLVWYGSPRSRKELFATLKYLEPTTSFRGIWQYQNLMYMTAGYLLEEVTGQSWEAYIKSNFLDPLQMTTANTSVEVSKSTDDFAYGYRRNEEEVLKMDFRNIDAIGPAGSINASALEMANWLIMQLNGGKFGETEIIGAADLAQTHVPHMVMPGGMTDEVSYRSYGLGWFLATYRGKFRVEHGGNIDGFSANVCLFPRDSIGIVVLTNMNGTGATGVIRNLIADRLLDLEYIDWNEKLLADVRKAEEAQQEAAGGEEEEDLARKKNTKPSHDLAAYTGTYKNHAYGPAEITLDGKTLKLKHHVTGEAMALEHYHYDVFNLSFLGQNLKFWFETGPDGEIARLVSELQNGVDPIVFDKQPKIEKLTAEQLAPYTGEYELMGTTVTVSVKDGELKMLVPGQPEYTLLAVGEHTFNLQGLDGYKAIFKIEEGADKAASLASVQPNGTFTIKRKE